MPTAVRHPKACIRSPIEVILWLGLISLILPFSDSLGQKNDAVWCAIVAFVDRHGTKYYSHLSGRSVEGLTRLDELRVSFVAEQLINAEKRR